MLSVLMPLFIVVGCMGENPYIRMQRIDYGGKCKMCDRPYTMFKWRPGRGEGYRKTEVRIFVEFKMYIINFYCQVCLVCSKLKNICQTCILDMQFGNELWILKYLTVFKFTILLQLILSIVTLNYSPNLKKVSS